MRERFIITFLFHLVGISLLLIPNQYQGPIVSTVFGVPLRVMDAIAIILIFAGSAFIYSSIFFLIRNQIRKQEQELSIDKKQINVKK